jgi:hypothetical protein
MSKASFIDAIDGLKFAATEKMAAKTDLPMGLMFEYESKLIAPDSRIAREMEITIRFGGKVFIDESLGSGYVDSLLSRMKSDMKRVAFSDALDFAQSVVAVAAKNGNQELLKMAFDFQDRILRSN